MKLIEAYRPFLVEKRDAYMEVNTRLTKPEATAFAMIDVLNEIGSSGHGFPELEGSEAERSFMDWSRELVRRRNLVIYSSAFLLAINKGRLELSNG